MQHKLDDLKELHTFLSQSQRANVKLLLQNEIDKINSEIEMLKNVAQTQNSVLKFEGINKFSWNDEGQNIS